MSGYYNWILVNAIWSTTTTKIFVFVSEFFFNTNLFYRFKSIQIAKNLNLTCVRRLEVSVQKVHKYRPPLHSSQHNSLRDLRKVVLHLTTWFKHCDIETSTKRFALGKRSSLEYNVISIRIVFLQFFWKRHKKILTWKQICLTWFLTKKI